MRMRTSAKNALSSNILYRSSCAPKWPNEWARRGSRLDYPAQCTRSFMCSRTSFCLHEISYSFALQYWVVHLVVHYVLLTWNWELRYNIRRLYCDWTFVMMSTKGSAQPDRPHCSLIMLCQQRVEQGPHGPPCMLCYTWAETNLPRGDSLVGRSDGQRQLQPLIRQLPVSGKGLISFSWSHLNHCLGLTNRSLVSASLCVYCVTTRCYRCSRLSLFEALSKVARWGKNGFCTILHLICPFFKQVSKSAGGRTNQV